MDNPILPEYIQTIQVDQGLAIKEKRLNLNMTQKELADSVGMPKFGDRTIRRWEKGETSPSPLEFLSIMEFWTLLVINRF